MISSPMSDIELRVCKTWDDCIQCENLQQRVWEMPDARDIVPAHFLITAVKNGGLLIGAFDDAEMVGFAFGFLGSDRYLAGQGVPLRLKHTSHMLAVVPGIRAQGLGAALKWKQRAEALAQGLDLMTWTYDPLQAANANLNLARLGALGRRYIRDAYGEMTDALNVGVASDRFEVEWYMPSARVQSRLAGSAHPIPSDAQPIYTLGWDSDGFPVVTQESPLSNETFLVEIPADFNAIKAKNHSLAVQWRELTRNTFERAFAAGYVASDVTRSDLDGHPRVQYVLERDPQRLQNGFPS